MYVEINEFGQFVKEVFDPTFISQEIIVSSAWSNDNLLFSTFGDYSTYLDNNHLGIVNVFENRLPYSLNDTSYYSIYLNENCFENNKGFQCVARVIGAEPHAGIINYYNIIDDSIVHDTFVSVTPLYKRLGVIKASIIEEEIIICANGYLNSFENGIGNDLFVTKVDREFPNNEICSTVFSSGEGLVILDFETDQDENIIVVGFKVNNAYSSGKENFHLKISNNCEVLSSSMKLEKDDLLQIFPNPTNDFVTVNKPNDLNIERIDVYSIDGSLHKSLDNNHLNVNRLDLSDLTIGIYFIIFSDENGNLIRRKISVVD